MDGRFMVLVSHTLLLKMGIADKLDGMYGNFAGRDASRGMAKQSFDEGELVDLLDIMT